MTKDPSRKRTIRLVVSLVAAVGLGVGLIYTSFSAASDAVTPSELLREAEAGKTYQLTGKVEDGSVRRDGATLVFRVRDREGTASVPVRYTGSVPDPFREGREVIIDVKKSGNGFVGEKDTLVTKCPSKFTEEGDEMARPDKNT